jgi:TolA-binding protein
MNGNYIFLHLFKILLKGTFLFFLISIHIGIGREVIAQQSDAEVQLAEAYFADQEYAKALETYQKLYQADNQNALFIKRIVECNVNLKQFKETIDFLDKVIRRLPEESQYIAQKGFVLQQSGKSSEAKKTWQDLIQKKLKSEEQFTKVSNFFISVQLNEEAEKTLLKAREKLGQPQLYSRELSSLYAFRKAWDLAVDELLQQYYNRPDNLGVLKVQLMNLATDAGSEGQEVMERALLEALNNRDKDTGLKELIIDYYLGILNYSEALIQTRSLDLLLKENGTRIFRLALILQQNRQYDLSNKALDYIINGFPQSPNYLSAWTERAINSELKALQKNPVDTTALKDAIQTYDGLVAKFGLNLNFYDALFRKSKLCIFYLHDLTVGMKQLNELLTLPLSAQQKAEVNLLMGDVWLMKGDVIQAGFKYAEVEESFKEDQLGAQAKFRLAKLNYYIGNFKLSSARLKSLKENSSNDIANDALKLNLLISQHTLMDTLIAPLQIFSNAQFLIYQQRFSEAENKMDSLLKAFPGHELKANILWEKAQIRLTQGQTSAAITLLEELLKNYDWNVLADDALFNLAEIAQFQEQNSDKAQSLYLRLITDFPGSLFKVEARKRIRQLRGEVRIP